MSDPKNTPVSAPNAPVKPGAPPSAGAVYFCTVSGVRIVAPGVSRDVDPENGVDAYRAPTSKQR